MKRIYLLGLLVTTFMSGCGGVEWFPDKTTTPTPTPSAPTLTRSFLPVAVLANMSTNLKFTITNGTGSPAQSGLAFVDTLPAGLAVTAASPQCGGTVTAFSNQISLLNGTLAVGAANCTIAAKVLSAVANTYVNHSTDIASLGGGLLNGVTDQTLTVFPRSVTNGAVTVSNLVSSVSSQTAATVTYVIELDGTNSSATDIGVQANIVALDAAGVEIPTTRVTVPDPAFFQTFPANTTTPQLLLARTVDVPIADSQQILFWRIVSIVLQ